MFWGRSECHSEWEASNNISINKDVAVQHEFLVCFQPPKISQTNHLLITSGSLTLHAIRATKHCDAIIKLKSILGLP